MVRRPKHSPPYRPLGRVWKGERAKCWGNWVRWDKQHSLALRLLPGHLWPRKTHAQKLAASTSNVRWLGIGHCNPGMSLGISTNRLFSGPPAATLDLKHITIASGKVTTRPCVPTRVWWSCRTCLLRCQPPPLLVGRRGYREKFARSARR